MSTPLIRSTTSMSNRDDDGKKQHERDSDTASVTGRVSALAKVPLKYKILALFCAAMIGFGSHFGGVSYGTLKTQLKKEMKLSNSQYAVTQAANDVLTTFMPLLGGFLFDYYGTGVGSLVTTVLVACGILTTAVALDTASFGTLVAGRMIYGVGSGAVNVIQQLIIAQWFEGTGLATAMAILLAINRAGTAIGTAVVVPASVGRFYSFGTWIAVGVAAGSVVFNVFYVLTLKRVERQQLSDADRAAMRRKKSFSPTAMLRLPGMFWLIMVVHYLASAVMNGYLGIAADFIVQRDKVNVVTAVYNSTISLAVTAVVYVLCGPLVDRFGHRISLSLLSNVLLILFFVLMEWTRASSLGMMIMFAFTIPFKALASLVAIPLLVPTSVLGTSFAIYRCTNSIASAITDTLSGVIQDASTGNKDKYTGVVIFYLAMAVGAFLLNLVWWRFDQRDYDGMLQKPAAQQEEYLEEKKRREEAEADQAEVTSFKPRFTWRWTWSSFAAIVWVVALNAAWILFLVVAVKSGSATPAKGGKGK
ncbi:hypothetical protein GGF32_008853 [Allomyces javanicus]|nr:hypothetical protein GGF32_008853 [Allomyces javanicus]